MALGDRYTKTVVFILGGNNADTATLQGTGFVAGALTDDPNIVIPFVVTAAAKMRRPGR